MTSDEERVGSIYEFRSKAAGHTIHATSVLHAAGRAQHVSMKVLCSEKQVLSRAATHVEKVS